MAEQSYEYLMNAARNADAAGDQNAAKRLVQLAMQKRSAPAPQAQVSVLEDTGRSLGSGIVRGAIGTAELPELLGRAGIRGYQEIKQLLGGEVENEMPILDTATGRALRGATTLDDYQAQTGLGQLAGTIGEFAGGAGALGAAGKGVKLGSKLMGSSTGQKVGEAVARTGLTKEAQTTAAVAGAGSEAFGQMTEGTELEPYARLVGAIVAPSVGNKTLSVLQKRSSQRPTVNALKAEKNQAYQMVSQAGEAFTPQELQTMVRAAQTEARVAGYLKSTDDQTKRALKLLESLGKSKTPVYMDDIDKVRRRLSKMYKNANDEVAILSAIKTMDDMVAGKADTNELVGAARAANTKYMKAQLLEKKFKKADDQISSTGSGGNTVNKYRQTVTSILNDERNIKFFSDTEIEAMQKIVDGSLGFNTMRLIGKLSPTGNGVMAAFNIAAVASNPAFIGMSVVGGGAKALSDAQMIKAVNRLQDLVAAGGGKATKPELRAVILELMAGTATRTTGLAAMEQ